MTDNEILVICEHCSSVVPIEDAELTGQRVGPDLMVYDVYLCIDCLEEIYGEED
jgi:hypothetical protein